jgi:SAM-dependent methyltransferase
LGCVSTWDGGEAMFKFGQNWSDYVKRVGRPEITEAVRGLARLLGAEVSGKSFLDVGCGSGIHSLAALELGAREVVAFDVDPHSTAAAEELLSRYAKAGGRWRVYRTDLFEVAATEWGRFDIVYAWGVLHHTGDVRRAIRHCATLVAPGGMFAIALYRKTWLCWLWRAEKRWYARAKPSAQAAARRFYLGLFALGLWITGRSLKRYAENYVGNRGMSFYHDVHDWLGGWPYESLTPTEVNRIMCGLGFVRLRSFVRNGRLFGRDIGLFGSGCDEYVYALPG